MSDSSLIDLVDSDSEDDDDFACSPSSMKRKATVQPRRSKRIRSTTVTAPKPNEMNLVDSSDEEIEESSSTLFERLQKRTRGQRKVLQGALKCPDSDDDIEEEKKEDDFDSRYGDILPSVSESPTSSTTTKKASSSKTKVNPAAAESYLKSLRASVKKRMFPLSQILKEETFTTGRTIKPQKAWKGHFPALREFLQNTIDHLGLMDGKTGRRHACIELNVKKCDDDHPGTLATFEFSCQNHVICKFIASRDELVIEQLYTFPIASRALDTGVPDETKTSSSNSNQAGGFGDGFKTAAVALIANGKKGDFSALDWYFYAKKEKMKIHWAFEGLTREKVATFAKCQVLQVKIQKSSIDNKDLKSVQHLLNSELDDVGQNYIMRQRIQVKGIGKAFIEQAVPRFVVFWDLDESSLISMKKGSRGGDFIGSVPAQPNLFNGQLGNIKPHGGVYVRGIWVRPAKIKDTLMCFFGNRLEVIGRDRNEVDDDELVEAVVYVIRRCGDLQYLKKLLAPLRGGEGGSGRGNTSRGNSASWLLQSPRFFNRIIETEKDFILYEVFGIPRGAIFVSSKTTSSVDPFIKWAATFLKQNGAPLIPIEKGSNRYLFEEVNEFELTDRCVDILKNRLREHGKQKNKNGSNVQSFFRKLFTFMGIGNAKVFFSPDVSVAFVHNASIYIPETTLSRGLIVKVLNVCNSYLDGADAENYSCLMQAIFETLPAQASNGLQLTDATAIVNRAKSVAKETKKFLSAPSATATNGTPGESEDVVVIEVEETRTSTSTRTSEKQDKGSRQRQRTGTSEQTVPTTMDDLEEDINRINTIAGSEDNDKIIPETDFEDDLAGNNDHPLRAHSALENVTVDRSLGGGEIFFDGKTLSDVKAGKWSSDKKKKILALRQILSRSKDIIEESIPTLKKLLTRVNAGYDGDNDTYEAFCDGRRIVVNLYAFLPKIRNIPPTAPFPDGIVHDLVVVVTHELAHFLKPRAGHGPVWRDTHMKMMIRVMNHLKKE